MKKVMMMGGVCISLVCGNVFGGDDPVNVSLHQTGNEYAIEGSVDLLAFSKKERKARKLKKIEIQNETKNFTRSEKIKYHFMHNWEWYIGAIGSLVLIDRVSENNDWLWYKSDKSKKLNLEGHAPGCDGTHEPIVETYDDGTTVTFQPEEFECLL